MDEVWVRKRKTCWRSHLEKISAVFSARSCSRCAQLRLTAYGGSSFEPILQAFHQKDFIALVQQFLGSACSGCMEALQGQPISYPRNGRSLNACEPRPKPVGLCHNVSPCRRYRGVKSIMCPTAEVCDRACSFLYRDLYRWFAPAGVDTVP